MSISTHVLEAHLGRPASGVSVELDFDDAGEWRTLNATETDADGRVRELLPAGETLQSGVYCLRFASGAYYERHNAECLYPIVEITLTVRDDAAHYHVPLLLTPNSYSTYRGS